MAGHPMPGSEDFDRAEPDEPIDDIDASDGHGEEVCEFEVVCLECGERSMVAQGEEECPSCGSEDLELSEEE